MINEETDLVSVIYTETYCNPVLPRDVTVYRTIDNGYAAVVRYNTGTSMIRHTVPLNPEYVYANLMRLVDSGDVHVDNKVNDERWKLLTIIIKVQQEA